MTPRSKSKREPLDNAAARVEREVRKTINYLNDEVVPVVRVHSARGLRVAAKKLRQLADLLEEKG